MTTNERISRIEELKKLLMMSWQEADEVNKLRANLKVSDFFRWLMTVKKERRVSPDGFYKIMGYTEPPRYDIAGFHAGLEKAIENGYVARYTVKRYGRYIEYLELTKKGEKTIFK